MTPSPPSQSRYRLRGILLSEQISIIKYPCQLQTNTQEVPPGWPTLFSGHRHHSEVREGPTTSSCQGRTLPSFPRLLQLLKSFHLPAHYPESQSPAQNTYLRLQRVKEVLNFFLATPILPSGKVVSTHTMSFPVDN